MLSFLLKDYYFDYLTVILTTKIENPSHFYDFSSLIWPQNSYFCYIFGLDL